MSGSGWHPSRADPRLPVVSNLDEVRWQSVAERDANMADIFVYAVRTTGVFCRPGCSARRPLRRNVEFYASSDEAVAAGYRACLRCTPQRDHPQEPAVSAVIQVCRWLEGDEAQQRVAAMATTLGYSERHLRRCFLALVGVSIGNYRRAIRADQSRSLLRKETKVSDVIWEAGYGSSRAFYTQSASRLGMAPANYRAGARGERLRFTLLSTSLGILLVAQTSLGICSVQLGTDESTLTENLVAEFPLADCVRDDDGLADVATVLEAATRGDRDLQDLPLDLRGTAFQIRVWEVLRAIPIGRTRTYSQIAAQIGSPRAVRAVASACAANPAALAVPCHRVVRKDGSLGGYRWGLAAKQALLSSEASAPTRQPPVPADGPFDRARSRDYSAEAR